MNQQEGLSCPSWYKVINILEVQRSLLYILDPLEGRLKNSTYDFRKIFKWIYEDFGTVLFLSFKWEDFLKN